MRIFRFLVFRPIFTLAVLTLPCMFLAEAQELNNVEKTEVEKTTNRTLKVKSVVESATEIAPAFGPGMLCDRDGNLFLHGENFAESGFRKISPKGERLATFDPKADPHLKFMHSYTFAVGRGELYAVVYPEELTKYLLVYDLDGKYKSTIKLDSGYIWFPGSIGIFQSGEILLSGTRYAKGEPGKPKQVPFTGIFKPDGTLLKEITLPDDSELQQLGEAGDPRYVSSDVPGANRAIDLSQIKSAEDGNVYLMRWTNPSIFYVIAPTGDVVRRFTVDPDDEAMHAMSMHISGNRLAVLFFQPQTKVDVLKIVDLEGHEIITYKQELKTPGSPRGALGCYSADPERFTFLGVTNDRKLKLTFAEGE